MYVFAVIIQGVMVAGECKHDMQHTATAHICNTTTNEYEFNNRVDHRGHMDHQHEQLDASDVVSHTGHTTWFSDAHSNRHESDGFEYGATLTCTAKGVILAGFANVTVLVLSRGTGVICFPKQRCRKSRKVVLKRAEHMSIMVAQCATRVRQDRQDMQESMSAMSLRRFLKSRILKIGLGI